MRIDPLQQVERLDWRRALGIVFGFGAQVLFAFTVCGLFIFLFDSRAASWEDSANWFVVDSLLALQFAVVHSLMLLPAARSRIAAWLPSSLYGTLFCFATCGGLWLIFEFWHSSPTVIWQATGATAIAVRIAFCCSWVALFFSIRLGGLGYQTGWTQWLYWFRRKPLPRRGLTQHGAYRWLRHPVYLSFLGLIWLTPQMTLDHALLTGAWTAYIFVGSVLKDRRLEYYLGDEYREYASRVAGYPGMIFGPLAKWPPLERRELQRRVA